MHYNTINKELERLNRVIRELDESLGILKDTNATIRGRIRSVILELDEVKELLRQYYQESKNDGT